MSVLNYRKDLQIRNLTALRSGLNCRYLVCIRGQGNDLVAKSWHRRLPQAAAGEVIVDFEPGYDHIKDMRPAGSRVTPDSMPLG